jgi:1-acyl-sn-glycerol-3-phosphate acyltransferase
MKKKISFFYEFLRPPVWLTSLLFYRKFSVNGLKENFPRKNQATILISNHQNGMMDPVMACLVARRQLHFLTRADLFQGKLANKILRHMNMLPVYRARDKVADIAAMNDDTFNTSYNRILAGDVISMFPEGNHNNKKWVRPFRKGIARVTFGAMQQADYQRDIQIIPVGIDYTAYTKFRGSILLNFGKPVSTLKYADLHKKDPARALITLVKETTAALKALVIDVNDKENYDWLIETEMLALETHTNGDQNSGEHLERLRGFQDFLAHWDEYREAKPEAASETADNAKRYVSIRQKLKLSERAVWDTGQKCETIIPMIGMFLITPLILLGAILNVIPAFITRQFVSAQVKDTHFKSSITLAMGMVFFGIFWLFQALLISWLTSWPWSGLILFVASPFTGLVTIECWQLFGHLRMVNKLRRLTKSKNADALDLGNLRTNLVTRFKEISKTTDFV